MLDKVKLALRIQHSMLDADILDTIGAARSELIRAGVPAHVAMGDSELVQMAIKTYCLYIYADEKRKDGFWKSLEIQIDQLRKSAVNKDGDLYV